MTARLSASLHAAALVAGAHPRHLGLLALVVGLLAGGWLPLAGVAVTVLAAALIAVLLHELHFEPAERAGSAARERLPWVLVAVALVGGAAWAGHARVDALAASSLGPRLGHAVRADATLLEAPRARAGGGWWGSARVLGEPVLLQAGRWAQDGGRPPRGADAGTVVRVAGLLQPPDDFARSRGAHAALRVDEATPTGRHRGGPSGTVDVIRRRSEVALGRGLPAAQGGLLRGMVLGQDAAIPEGVRDDFRAAGLSHLVAASGTNVALLAVLGLAAGTLLGLGRVPRLVVVLALVALYVPLAGAGPPIQRAGVMGAAGIVAALAGRAASRTYALGLAAVVTLALDPRAAGDVGWQLSFAAVVGIGLLAPGWGSALRDRGAPPVVAEACAMTLAATLATAPLLAARFGEVSLAGLPANVLAAPVIAPIMWLGYVAALLGLLAPVLATPLVWPAAVGCGYLTSLAHAAARLPWAVVAVGVVPAALTAAALVALGRSASLRRVAPVGALGAVLAALALAPARAAPAGTPTGLRLSVLDVGQGNALLVQDGPHAALFDTGPPDGPVLQRLREAGIDRLELLVITHGSSDHEGMGAAILGAVRVDRLVDGRRTSGAEPDEDPATGEVVPGDAIRAAAAARGVPVSEPAAGQVLALGGARLRVLWPPPIPPGAPSPAVEDHNERAMVTLVEARGRRLLIPADAESPVLARLALPQVDVLQVSHHGSEDPGLPQELATLRPAVAVIPVGRHNDYGHPRPGTLAALSAAGVPALRTDRDGTIRLDLAGDRWLVRTSRRTPDVGS